MLKLDEIYQLDHVSAYNIITNSITKSKSNSESKLCTGNLSSLEKAKPLPSKKFRVQNIISCLNNHFIQCWEHEKSNSSKLSFYHIHKNKFAREMYIDNVRGFSRRYSTTKLRISSHDLEIERGRYSGTPKELRFCNWCHTSMGEKIIENENHLMFECDLYASLRSKLISQLNSLPETCMYDQDSNPLTLNVSNTILKENFMTMLSPYTVPDINEVPTNIYNNHHKLLLKYNRSKNNHDMESIINRQSHIINCLSTFIYRALEKRLKYIKNVRENEKNRNTFVFTF